MPVFNGGHYFQEALESALAQDYENFEIVVVNDGSTDGGETERIALSYGDRVRYFHQENRGVSGALNTALAHMSGDYFAWLSHDDLHVPHKTAAQIDYLGRLGRPRACLFADYDLIGPAGELIATVRLPAELLRRNPRLPLLNGMINGCTLLIPADIIREFGPFDEALRATQDYDLWNRILARQEFFHQPEVLVRYRIHPGQGTHSMRAVTEGDVLWKAMLDSRSEVERAQMFGSTRRYYSSLATFLDATPYKGAAAYAHARAAGTNDEVLVSVIIPFWNEVSMTLRAAQSALDQTHRHVEVVLVNDGSTQDIAPLVALADNEPRVKLLSQGNAGPAAARNKGLDAAQGAYIAFLDADDQFLPQKIERQLEQMQRHGALLSHTSYYVAYPECEQGYGLLRSGVFGGSCYPQIIGSCPIAMPTVMIHRSLIDEGFAFPCELRVGEDMLAWIDLALRYALLGIDEPLSIVEWMASGAALSRAKEVVRLSEVVEALRRHPLHKGHTGEIDRLAQAIRDIAKQWIDAGREIEKIAPRHPRIEIAFPALQAFPAAAAGRAGVALAG
jgi:glycosyltransferase involved in cell wall biosynthesis